MNRMSAILVILIALLVGISVMVELVVTETSFNRIGFYLTVSAFLGSLLSPKKGYVIIIAIGAYLELLKFAAWWQYSKSVDTLMINLSPIAAVSGICCGCLIGFATGRLRLTKELLFLWFGTIVVGCLVGAKILLSRGISPAGLGEAANVSGYLMLVPATATLLRTQDDWRNFLTASLWILAPSAFYGIYQALAGYPDLHYQFVSLFRGRASGVEAYIQPAGTMNGPISFGTTMAIAFCMAIVRTSLRPKVKFVDIFFFLLFLSATIGCARRSAMLLIVVFLVGLVFFKTRGRALALYAGATVFLASLFIFANPLIYFFHETNRKLQSNFGGDNFLSRVTNTGTFNDRLLGFRNMTRNPDLWSLFGAKLEKGSGKFGFGMGEDSGTLRRQGNFDSLRDDYVHDGLSKAIISYGVVPVFVALLCLGLIVLKVHRIQFSVTDQVLAKQMRYGVSFLFALGAIVFTSQQALVILPINIMAFSLLGVFVAMGRVAKDSMGAPSMSQQGGNFYRGGPHGKGRGTQAPVNAG